MSAALFPTFVDPPDKIALRFGDRELTYEDLRGATARLGGRIAGAERIAVWADPTIDSCVGVMAVLVAGAAAVPINPGLGRRELEHIVGDSRPSLLIAPNGSELPPELGGLDRVPVEPGTGAAELPEFDDDTEAPALIL